MKSITQSINESKEISYRVSIYWIGPYKVPIDVTMTIDKEDQRHFEKWLEEEEGMLFAHAQGGDIEY